MGLVEWALIVALLWGGGEHLRAEHHKDNAIEYKENYELAVKANESNIEAINELSAIHDQTLAILKETKDRQLAYERINRDNEVRIEELEGVIATYDWSRERIPLEIVDLLSADQ